MTRLLAALALATALAFSARNTSAADDPKLGLPVADQPFVHPGAKGPAGRPPAPPLPAGIKVTAASIMMGWRSGEGRS